MMKNIDEDLKNAITCNDMFFLERNESLYDINHRFYDEENDTLLLYSISDKGSKMYSYFLENGADITLKNNEGEGIIHSIVYSGRSERLLEVLAHEDFSCDLLDTQANDGTTPLLLSVLLHKKRMFNLLLQLGANVNLADDSGNTPIHPACYLGYMDMVKALIDKGADLHVKTQKGNYPLALAVNGDWNEIVKYLYSRLYK